MILKYNIFKFLIINEKTLIIAYNKCICENLFIYINSKEKYFCIQIRWKAGIAI